MACVSGRSSPSGQGRGSVGEAAATSCRPPPSSPPLPSRESSASTPNGSKGAPLATGTAIRALSSMNRRARSVSARAQTVGIGESRLVCSPYVPKAIRQAARIAEEVCRATGRRGQFVSSASIAGSPSPSKPMVERSRNQRNGVALSLWIGGDAYGNGKVTFRDSGALGRRLRPDRGTSEWFVHADRVSALQWRG